jgi:hypothetical protein
MIKPQGGATANASGSTGESIIHNFLLAQGIALATKEEHRAARALLSVGYPIGEALLPQRFYRQLPAFNSLYGVSFKADFVINSKDIGLIEMKWQVSAGSVDEKLPFWLLTLQQLPPNIIAMLVVIGGGIRPGAMDWIRKNAGKTLIAGDLQEVQKIIRTKW